MFLRAVFILLVSSGAFAQAGPVIPGLEKKTLKLKTLTKDRQGKKTVSSRDRDSLCGGSISAKVREEDGKVFVELNSLHGLEWGESSEEPTTSDNCKYSSHQSIQSSGDSSVLTVINAEECKNGRSLVGSQRDTWTLRPGEITLQAESVAIDRSGQWQVIPAKEGYTCTWTVDGK